jgi:uncharacterized protein with HEPN domain
LLILINDRERLLDILTYCDQVIEVASAITRDDLFDFRNLNCLAYSIQTIGEAASHLSDSFRKTNTDVEWEKVIAMRHRLVHGYGKLDLDIIWNVSNDEVPLLRTVVIEILKDART